MTDPVGTNAAAVEQVVSQQQAAASVEQREAVRSLASALATETTTSAMLIKGVVTAVNLTANPRTLSAQLEGDTTTTVSDIAFIHSYTPVVGDTVHIIKQGSSILAVGCPSIPAATPAADGWIQPSLGSNVTTHAIDPVRYRVVVDNGTRKVQLRGAVNVASSATTLWTMPTDARPVITMQPIVVARETGGGSAVAHLIPNSSGVMQLSAVTVGITGMSSSGGGGATTSDGNEITNTSGAVDVGAVKNPPFSVGSTPMTFSPDGGDTSSSHVHAMYHTHAQAQHFHGQPAHSHDIPNHTHTMTSVTHPTLVSFNGVEYFL